MTIEVRCPEGHLISCPEDKIGQMAKCPKCGSPFQIVAHQPVAGVAQEEMIAFLCPNGHKLTGPASLQGRPGQCPHCHSKFVIPDYSEVPQDTFPTPDGQHFGEGMQDDIETLEELASVEDLHDLATEDTAIVTSPASTTQSLVPGETATLHPLAETFQRLWANRENGASLEIHLTGGDVIKPDHFATSISGQTQGVFATKNEDGTYTLTAVAWDAVAQITVRGVQQLPGDLFLQ